MDPNIWAKGGGLLIMGLHYGLEFRLRVLRRLDMCRSQGLGHRFRNSVSRAWRGAVQYMEVFPETTGALRLGASTFELRRLCV